MHAHAKKIGRIPEGAVACLQPRYRSRQGRRAWPRARGGYTYLHSAVNGHTRLLYSETVGAKRAAATSGLYCRARAFLAARGIIVDKVITVK